MPKRNLANLDTQITQNYYSASEAQHLLGMNRDKFNYTMKARGIKSHPFLKGYGFYRKAEIEEIADEIEAYLIAGEKARFEYQTATPDTLNDEIEIAALNFGRKRAEATRKARIRFLEANSEMTHYLYRNGVLVASINLVPLVHEAILEFRDGKRGWLFDTEQIERFEPGRRLECVIIDMMTTTRITPDQRNRCAGLLLNHFKRETLVPWGQRGIDLATVDACAGTDDGERILKRAGFAYWGTHQEREMYHLDIDASDLPLLTSYKEALAAWKQNH